MHIFSHIHVHILPDNPILGKCVFVCIGWDGLGEGERARMCTQTHIHIYIYADMCIFVDIYTYTHI